MHPLLEFLNALPAPERDSFASRCGTSVGYLRKAISAGQALGESLCINIERESQGLVSCEQLRPTGVDWAYLRGTSAAPPSGRATAADAHAAPLSLLDRRERDLPIDFPDRRAAGQGQ